MSEHETEQERKKREREEKRKREEEARRKADQAGDNLGSGGARRASDILKARRNRANDYWESL